ncbi:MAG: 50S ribosomal protein L30 [Gemmatimonadetes bacterium]|nr:50S ribosomal protein L30 [Gemmatimonadota bacterium]
MRSGVGRQAVQRRTLEALGLKRHQQTVVHDDTPQIRGMIEKVDYLLEVREVD